MAKKPFKPQVLTANTLVDGEVIYWREDGSWTTSLESAFVLETEDKVDPALASAQTAVKAQEILDPYLFEVECGQRRLHPVSVREQIRAKGPTVRLDLGKQAA